MFDGSFKSSRKVNLSGRKKPAFGYGASAGSGAGVAAPGASANLAQATSKEELLQQSKLLREERLAHRRRMAASTKIQAMGRRVATTRCVRSRVFAELEAELSTLVGPTGSPSAVVATPKLQLLLRKFLVAYGRRGRDERVLLARDVTAARLVNVQNYVIVMLLMSALQGKTSESNILAVPKDSTWLYQITRVLEISLRVAVEADASADQVKTACTVLLETFTTRDRYAAAGVRDVDDVLPGLLRRLSLREEFGTFEALQRLIQRQTSSSDRVAQIVCGLTFARKVMLSPSALSSPLITTATQLSWSERAIASGNVLDLYALSGFLPVIVQGGAALLARVVSKSHVQWAFDADTHRESSGIASTVEDVDMDDDEAAAARVEGQLVSSSVVDDSEQQEAQLGIQGLGQQQGSIKAQWQQLYDTTFTRRCFAALQDPTALQHMCRVYATFLLGLGRNHLLSVRQSFKSPPPALFSFLSSVSAEPLGDSEPGCAHDVAVVKRVWELVKASVTTTSSAAQRVSESVLQPLLVFNVIYSHMLLALDDETFYDRAWPFQLRDVCEIVSFLKTFIYDVCWNVNSSARSANGTIQDTINSDLFPALTTSVKLFNQLYDRDCRRHFTADNAWLWPSMPVIKETVDLESMEGDLYELQALASLMAPGGSLTPHARASLILTTIPQVFSFNDRVLLFEKLLDEEKRNMVHLRDEFSRAIQVRVKRDEIVDESFDVFQRICDSQSPSALKSRIKVTFVNEQGLEEAGIDGGGVFKEYIDQLTKSAFSPEYGFFLATNEQLLYPNPAARLIVDTSKEVTDRFRFLGRVLGKAVYEEILVEPQFAAFFLNKLLGKFNYIDDLHSLDPDLYRNLMQLKHYKGNVEDLALTFSVSEMEFGQVVTRHLVPDGANVVVTNENRIRYIHLLANYKLNVLSSHESAAFLRGFRDLIPAKWIQMFSPSELQTLIGGTANKIDVQDWQRHTAYGGGYHPSQRSIQWFWDIVEHDFDAEDRAALLKFTTSVSRQPLLGFGQLAPQICIHQVRIDDDERLPSSATCMNLLKLPTYSSKEIMKQKLLYAIRANAGFDLS